MPTTFTPYQVDHSIKNTSKTFGFSKKRVSFKFGIANNQALSEGQTGAGCRGSEHEIIFVWSLNSGKRQILADGKEVHYSESGQNGWTADQVFQHHFQVRSPNLSQPLRCHLITQPRNPDMPQIHPFDIRVNGISYFKMSKIFQLGTSAMRSKQIKGSAGGGAVDPEDDPYCTPEERRAIAQAKLESLRELRVSNSTDQGNGPGAKEEQSLISFDDPPPPPSAPGGGAPPGNFMSSVTLDPSIQSQQPPQQQQPYQQQGGYNNYSLGGSYGQPAPPAPAYGQQPPAYGQAPPAQSNAMQPYYGGPPQQSFGSSQQSYGSNSQQPSYNNYSTATQAPAPPAVDTYNTYGGTTYGAPAPMPDFASPTNQSTVSYGSAPSFAQPPQHNQQQQQQQQPQYGQQPQGGYSQQYSQPPPPQGFPQPY